MLPMNAPCQANPGPRLLNSMMRMYSTDEGTKAPAKNAATEEKGVQNDHLLKAGVGIKDRRLERPNKETSLSRRHCSYMEEPGYSRQRRCYRPGRHAALYPRHDRLPKERRRAARHLLRCRSEEHTSELQSLRH